MSMETLKRINLAQVKKMFSKAGVKPARNNSVACLLYAYSVTMETDEEDLDLDYDYMDGIIDGWDNYKDRSGDYDNPLLYRLGRSDGEAAAKIMKL